METIETTHLTWKDVCEDPNLRDLPFKIELTAQGQLLMSPTRLKHGDFQYSIARLLETHLSERGKIITECAIRTADGTRVADVGWFSQKRWTQVADAYDAPIAPEICIEVLSPGNTVEEMAMKRALYLEAGAQEVWICDIASTMHFFDADGQRTASALAPTFPHHINT